MVSLWLTMVDIFIVYSGWSCLTTPHFGTFVLIFMVKSGIRMLRHGQSSSRLFIVGKYIMVDNDCSMMVVDNGFNDGYTSC